MLNSLENKVAVITGAYGDIGFSICEKFAKNGINLAILGKDLEKLEYILKEDELPITENEIKLLIKRLINRRFLKC